MKALLLVALLAFAGIAYGDVVATIPLPTGPSVNQFYTAGGGDMYYTIGSGGWLYAVNLTSKELQWQKRFDTSSNEGTYSIYGLWAAPNGQVLINVVGEAVQSFDAMGNYLWLTSSFTMPTEKRHYTFIGNELFLASSYTGQLMVIDLATGNLKGTPKEINSGVIVGTDAYASELSESTGLSKLVKYTLPGMTKEWTLQNVGNFLTATSSYILVTNYSANGVEHDVLVYDASRNLQTTLHAMTGVYSSGFTPVVSGTTGLFICGEDTMRLDKIDLTNGAIMWQQYLGSGGGSMNGAIIADKFYVSISQAKLTIVDLGSGAKGESIEGVPYTPTHGVADGGDNKIIVANLQGYTVWDATTGKYVSRDETVPGYNPAAAYSWGSYKVITAGHSVVIES